MCPPCCSTRPAPSPTATAWRPSSSPSAGTVEQALAEVVLLSSLADETPEGRSIVELAETRYDLTPVDMPDAELVPFTAQTRMSGIEWEGRSIRKGAADAVRRWVEEQGGQAPPDLAPIVERIARARRHPAGRRRGRQGARRDPPEGHRQAGHRRQVRRDAGARHPHRS